VSGEPPTLKMEDEANLFGSGYAELGTQIFRSEIGG
jgi:hypothetical protein